MWCHVVNCHPIQGIFPLHVQCSWDRLHFHCYPDQDKANMKDKRVIPLQTLPLTAAMHGLDFPLLSYHLISPYTQCFDTNLFFVRLVDLCIQA